MPGERIRVVALGEPAPRVLLAPCRKKDWNVRVLRRLGARKRMKACHMDPVNSLPRGAPKPVNSRKIIGIDARSSSSGRAGREDARWSLLKSCCQKKSDCVLAIDRAAAAPVRKSPA